MSSRNPNLHRKSFMDVILGLPGFGMIHLLVGVAVVVLYVSPWLARLSPDTVRGILGDVDVPLETEQDLEIARKSYLVSILPVWPLCAHRVATYGNNLS